MGDEFKESDPPKVKCPDPKPSSMEQAEESCGTSSQTSDEKSEGSVKATALKTAKSGGTSSQTSDEKTEGSLKAASPQVLQPSVAPSVVEEKFADFSCFSDAGKLDRKEDLQITDRKGAFSKWRSPRKTQKPTAATGSPKGSKQETPPDKQDTRQATVSSEEQKGEAKKPSVMKRLFGWVKSPRKSPRKSDKVSLVDHDASATVPEAGPSSQVVQPKIPERPPMFAELTGQEGRWMDGKIITEMDSFEEFTESTSISLGVKKDLQSFDKGSPTDSREESTGDASSLEREFEELSSPSKSAQQGQKRTKAPSSDEDETKGDLAFCASPRKRAGLQLPDPKEEKSKDSEMTD